MRRRLRLRRSDGQVYLERWGLAHRRIGGVFLHRMTAPDPGLDLHDHPWTFLTVPLWGGYEEERLDGRRAQLWAKRSERLMEAATLRRGKVEHRRAFRPRRMRLDECHRITRLTRPAVWTLVLLGPVRRGWGFYTPDGFVDHEAYSQARRDLWAEVQHG